MRYFYSKNLIFSNGLIIQFDIRILSYLVASSLAFNGVFYSIKVFDDLTFTFNSLLINYLPILKFDFMGFINDMRCTENLKNKMYIVIRYFIFFGKKSIYNSQC